MSQDEKAMEEGGLKDRGITRDLSHSDLDDHASSRRMEIGVRLPNRPKRPKKNRRSKSGDKTSDRNAQNDLLSTQVSSPTETVQTLIGEVDDEQHMPHPTFCQLDLLYSFGEIKQWREYARWVKYEEDVEEGGERWSKPHVASLSLHSLFELRSTILNGAVILDLDAYHITQIIDIVLDQVINNKTMGEESRDEVRKTLMSQHVFAHQKRKRSLMPGSESDKALMKKSFSKGSKLGSPRSFANMEHANGDLKESPSQTKLNVDFMRKVPPDAQACNVMVGEIPGLKCQVSAFVRLSEARQIGDITEVPIPTRFVFILLGPTDSEDKCIEIGRSLSTVMVDEIMREVAYKARNRQELLTGLDEFLDQVTVLPPGEWDPTIRIEPPAKVPSQESRKTQKFQVAGPHVLATQEIAQEAHCDPTLVRSGKLFGGLIADVKRKVPWYLSDFKDALHIQCIASTIFLFLATLTPNVTFGGLLGQATDQYMGTMECILAAAIVGILFALFAGQPLNILGSTGPMLVLEMILYNFCKEMSWDFLPMRCWIGIWTTFLLLLIVAFDLSALVRYITRFTEESFACLIAIIFIYEAFKKQIHIIDHYGINPTPWIPVSHECHCLSPNMTDMNVTETEIVSLTSGTTVMPIYDGPSVDILYGVWDNTTNNTYLWANMTKDNCTKYGGILEGDGCDAPHYYPDVFFLSVLLFLGTYVIAMGLKDFKTSAYFPTFVRQMLSDFAVLIAIVLMVGLDMLIGVKTPKLEVPEKFQPTRFQDRGWFITPISDKNPWWVAIAAVVPAGLALVLIFMDQQITAVIVNRKENKLVKGNGYHLDLLVVAVCILICSVLGLPWYVAATVSALAHIMSLKKESETAAPGEKPMFLGCREQRVTALLVGILSGLAVFLTAVLKTIPMPVLYGVFLFMGVAALRGMQFVDRLGLLFMPAKYQPDFIYLRHVKINRIHLFTFIQIICLAVLWVIKMVKAISIAFPVMVVGTCFVRMAMNKLFTQYELSYLDDLMPGDEKNAEEDNEAEKVALMNGEAVDPNDRDVVVDVKMGEIKGDKFGGYQSVPNSDRVNISEEMSKTGIWMQVRRDSLPVIEGYTNGNQPKLTNFRRNASKTNFTLGDDNIPEENENRESKI